MAYLTYDEYKLLIQNDTLKYKDADAISKGYYYQSGTKKTYPSSLITKYKKEYEKELSPRNGTIYTYKSNGKKYSVTAGAGNHKISLRDKNNKIMTFYSSDPKLVNNQSSEANSLKNTNKRPITVGRDPNRYVANGYSIPTELSDLDSRAKVKAFQENMQSEGINLGNYGADGIWGPQTEAAYKQYLAKHANPVVTETTPETVVEPVKVNPYAYRTASPILENFRQVALNPDSGIPVFRGRFSRRLGRVMHNLGAHYVNNLGLEKDMGELSRGDIRRMRRIQNRTSDRYTRGMNALYGEGNWGENELKSHLLPSQPATQTTSKPQVEINPETGISRLFDDLMNNYYKTRGYQKGGKMNDKQLQQAFLQFLAKKSGAKDEKELEAYVKQIGEDGLKQAYAEFTELMQKQTQKAKQGAKLNYIKQLKHQCPDGQELVYYKEGGLVKCGCMGKKLEDGGKASKEELKGVARFKARKAATGMEVPPTQKKEQKLDPKTTKKLPGGKYPKNWTEKDKMTWEREHGDNELVENLGYERVRPLNKQENKNKKITVSGCGSKIKKK